MCATMHRERIKMWTYYFIYLSFLFHSFFFFVSGGIAPGQKKSDGRPRSYRALLVKNTRKNIDQGIFFRLIG